MSVSHLGTGYNLTRALNRVTFWAEGRTQNIHEAQYNPSELEMGIGHAIHDLQPIGWSGPIRQGSNTTEDPFSIKLFFNRRGQREIQSEVGFDEEVQWFGCFCYPERAGIGPKALCINWPNTVSMVTRVKEMKVSYAQWDLFLNVCASTITLTVVPYRKYLKLARDFRNYGFQDGTSGQAPGRPWEQTGPSGDVGDHDE